MDHHHHTDGATADRDVYSDSDDAESSSENNLVWFRGGDCGVGFVLRAFCFARELGRRLGRGGEVSATGGVAPWRFLAPLSLSLSVEALVSTFVFCG